MKFRLQMNSMFCFSNDMQERNVRIIFKDCTGSEERAVQLLNVN